MAARGVGRCDAGACRTMSVGSSSSSSSSSSSDGGLDWTAHGVARIEAAAALRDGTAFADACADAGAAAATSYERASKPARAALEATVLAGVRVGPPPHHARAARALAAAVKPAARALPAQRAKKLLREHKDACIARTRAAAAEGEQGRPPDLPRDVLFFIRALLAHPGDRAAFAGVCADWRNAARDAGELARPAVDAARQAVERAVASGPDAALTARLRFWDIGGAG